MKKRISKNNRLALCVISILLIASLLSACGKKENPQEEPDPGILLVRMREEGESTGRAGSRNPPGLLTDRLGERVAGGEYQ